jgi:hypothetical protein
VTDSDPGPELPEPLPEDVVQATRDLGAEQRLWLRACIQVLAASPYEGCPGGTVSEIQTLHREACQRAVRILRTDLPIEN